MKRSILILFVLAALFGASVLPAFAQETIITGNLSGEKPLPNGRPDDDYNECVYELDNSDPFYYELYTLTVSASGDYEYYDERDEPTFIDIWVSFYTGTPGNFSAAEPLGNGCFTNFDDTGTVSLNAGVTYTLMVSNYNDGGPDDPATGNWVFSMDGPGTVTVRKYDGSCPNPLTSGAAIYQLPAGAPAFFAANLSSQTNFTIPAGTWWITEFSGDFAKVWISCQANAVWVPANAVLR